MGTDVVEIPGVGFVNPEPSTLMTALLETAENIQRYAADAYYGERWPRTRFGEREKIPAIVRQLVLERDGYCCLNCGFLLSIKSAQLDHIVPWSAGGSDASHNLRVLCELCNGDRSNLRGGLDELAADRLPVTLVCAACYRDDDGEQPPVMPDHMIPAYCGTCGITSPTCPWSVY